jgi:hypothetical protein
MSLITKVGYVRSDLESLRHWCCEQSATEQSIFSRYASERTHKWFGYHVILTKPPVITEGYQDNRVTQLGDFLLPGWHSALLAHYQPGGYMKPHCDHHVFEPSLVLVNIGRATLRVGNQVYNLGDGEVICFKSDVEHELYPVQAERWSLIFRRIRSEYLPV